MCERVALVFCVVHGQAVCIVCVCVCVCMCMWCACECSVSVCVCVCVCVCALYTCSIFPVKHCDSCLLFFLAHRQGLKHGFTFLNNHCADTHNHCTDHHIFFQTRMRAWACGHRHLTRTAVPPVAALRGVRPVGPRATRGGG